MYLVDRTGQDRTGQDRTGQDRTGQDRTGQDRTGQDRTGQGKTRQDKGLDKIIHINRGWLPSSTGRRHMIKVFNLAKRWAGLFEIQITLSAG